MKRSFLLNKDESWFEPQMFTCYICSSFHIIKSEYTKHMKKLLSTFLTLFCFVFILVLPVFLWLHASMMSHHGMSAWDCIEHCMSSETHIHSFKMISLSNYIEVLVVKVFFTRIFDFILPLTLLYIVLIHAPPNLLKNIKNYNYWSLIGIVKLTT